MTLDSPKFTSQGAIVRIRLRNFMTYTDVTLKPGPNLNMILGPNGTGKSAIVCAIIVGLAGDVTLTGRASQISDLVKKGTNSSTTEIELYNGRGPNYVVKRKITLDDTNDKTGTKNTWSINGKAVLKNQVTDLTKKLSIKVDNLCQFLPQDSVTNFVKMNKQDLLCNTLEAAGDSKLVKDYRMLIGQTRDVEDKRAALETLRRQYQTNELNVNRLREEVERYRQREQLVKTRTICASKIHYVKYLEAKERLDICEKDLKDLENQLKIFEDSTQPFTQAMQLHKREEDSLAESVAESNRGLANVQKNIDDILNKIEGRKLGCQEEFFKFKSKQDKENTRGSRIKVLNQAIVPLESRINDIRNVNYTKEIELGEKEIAEKRARLLACGDNRSKIKEEISNSFTESERLKYEREQILSINDKKRAILPYDTQKILDWLSKNEKKFKQKIFTPMMCEINVIDVKYSSVVEFAVPSQELFAFVCQNEQDLRLFTQLVYDQLNLRFNVILTPDKTAEDFDREASRNCNLSDIVGSPVNYLRDLIDAPEPILNYLCGAYNFHRIPVIDNCSESQVIQILRICPKVYVGSNFYSVSRSRYDNAEMTVLETVKEPRYLKYTLDKKAFAACTLAMQNLEERVKELRKKEVEMIKNNDICKQEWQDVHDRLIALKRKAEEKEVLQTQIETRRREIAELESEKIDIENERQKLQRSVDKINLELVELLKQLTNQYINYRRLRSANILNCLLKKVANRNHRTARMKLKAAQEDALRIREELKGKQQAKQTLRRAFEAAISVADERIQGFNNGALDKASKKKFSKIPENTCIELQKKIDDLTLKIRVIHRDNGLVDDFERLVEELKDKEARIKELETSIQRLDDERATIKNDWRDKVEKVISVVNKNYRDFMQKLNYDGRVKLDFNMEQPDNFAQYGVAILVKYRDNETLIPLSSTRQSGGERSVATMIYMLALQTQTTVPFRCVDEINQGMDKENERKVFELLNKTADSSSSQYFLISPKLLDNLPYSEKMKIHVVFNGKKLHLDWNDIVEEKE